MTTTNVSSSFCSVANQRMICEDIQYTYDHRVARPWILFCLDHCLTHSLPPCYVLPANIFLGHGGVLKIGDLGMARLVMPPPETLVGLTSAVAGASIGSTSSGTRLGSSPTGSPVACGGGMLAPAGSGGELSEAVAPLRTLTPGVVGTVAYAAPEILDEQLQVPNAPVDLVLKVGVRGGDLQQAS